MMLLKGKLDMLNATVALAKDSDKKEKSSKKKGSAVT